MFASTKLRLLALAGLLMASATPAMALDLNGIEIGKPLDCKRMKTEGRFLVGNCESDDLLRWDTTLLGERGQVSIKLDPESRGVKYAMVKSDFDFAGARKALTKKFGEPACTESQMTSGNGASFTRSLCRWEDGTAVVSLSQNVDRIGDRSLQLTGQA